MKSSGWPEAAASLAGALLAGFAGFLAVAPNRLSPASPVGLFATGTGFAPFIPLGLLLVAGCLAWRRPRTAGAVCVVLIWLLLLAAGDGADMLLRHAPKPTRVSFGGGFWLLLALCALLVAETQRLAGAGPRLRVATAVLVLAGLAAIAATHRLAGLSLLREYATHRAAFHAAVGRHLLLVILTLAGALLLGLPLGLAAWRYAKLRAPIFGVLNVVQTVPSVALFGLLMAPLSAAGLGGIGVVPAVIALVLYALLPTVRGLFAGLRSVDAAPLEAAAGMGMSASQVFLNVHLPLAAPALFAGLRVVLVQTIGLAVVAALIGAGGFGEFVFQGLGQYALDLVLLGALPATCLALAADALLMLAADTIRARVA